jgi:hypothetical protein
LQICLWTNNLIHGLTSVSLLLSNLIKHWTCSPSEESLLDAIVLLHHTHYKHTLNTSEIGKQFVRFVSWFAKVVHWTLEESRWLESVSLGALNFNIRHCWLPEPQHYYPTTYPPSASTNQTTPQTHVSNFIAVSLIIQLWFYYSNLDRWTVCGL